MIKKVITIKCASGLLIGSGNDDFKLGGVDSSTITKYMNGNEEPYIPATSLKGKLRFLATHQKLDSGLCGKYFGTGGTAQSEGAYFSRILFCDLHVVSQNKDQSLFEIKSENTLQKKVMPRTNKRSASGLTFQGDVMLPDEDAEKFLTEVLDLLKDSYIGGQGSRGYGWIESITLTNQGEEV